MDRSIQIELRRKLPGEQVERLRLDRLNHFVEVQQRAKRWALDASQALNCADPTIPSVLFNRAADNWLPLLAIADNVGGQWPARARITAERTAASANDDSAGIMLLGDLRALFDARATKELFTVEIIASLATLEHRPWPEWREGKPITECQLAELLAPYGIRPGTVRRESETRKGYRRIALEDVFSRYLT
jgi:putative DNA primase/helicase